MSDRRRVDLRDGELQSELLNPGLDQKFEVLCHVAYDSWSADTALLNFANLLKEYGYSMEIYSTVKLENLNGDGWCEMTTMSTERMEALRTEAMYAAERIVQHYRVGFVYEVGVDLLPAVQSNVERIIVAAIEMGMTRLVRGVS